MGLGVVRAKNLLFFCHFCHHLDMLNIFCVLPLVDVHFINWTFAVLNVMLLLQNSISCLLYRFNGGAKADAEGGRAPVPRIKDHRYNRENP